MAGGGGIPRVLMVLPRLETGGMECTVLAQAHQLRAAGVEVALAALSPGGDLEEQAAARGVPVVSTPGVTDLKSGAAFVGAAATQVGATLVHSHTGAWLPSAIAARRLRVPHVHTRHGFNPGATAAVSEFLAARSTSHVVCVSEELARHGRQILRIPGTRLEVVPNGADLATLPEPAPVAADADPALVMVCRLVTVKNIPLVLEALRLVRPRVPRLTLTLMGDGPEREALTARAEALGVADAVRFLGMVERPWSHLPPGGVFVQSSDSEGLSVSLIEAMAMGCRVVATAVGQTATFVDGAPGVRLVPPREVPPMAAALEAMACMAPGEARHLEAANRAHARAVGGVGRVVERLRSRYAALAAAQG